METPTLQRRVLRESGFTLVEALIALLVMAFGMLAVAGFQATLSGNSDLAKQRSEAVRLAQLKIEDLRSFAYVTATTGQADYTDAVTNTTGETISASSTYFTNTEFTRKWWVTSNGSTTAVATDLQKWIKVEVSWLDRTNTSQSVTLVSVMSRSDPVNMKLWTTSSGSTTSRKPKNRDINIPYPATDFGDGSSGFAPGGASGVYFIFDNTTGEVTHRCIGSTLVSATTTGNGCTAQTTNGYLLSGYIYWYTGNSAPSSSDLTVTIANNNPNLQDPPPLLYTDVDSVGATNSASVQFITPTTGATKECFLQKQMTLSSSHEIVTYVASTSHDYAFATYVCVITPVVVTTGTTARWSGQFTIVTDSTHTLGTGSTNYKLCRFNGDYDSDDDISNSEHPLYYRGVTGTLDSQNYVLIPGNRTCPTEGEATPLTGDYTNNNTTTHQTEAVSGGTQPYGGSLSTSSQWATTVESSDTTDELPMN